MTPTLSCLPEVSNMRWTSEPTASSTVEEQAKSPFYRLPAELRNEVFRLTDSLGKNGLTRSCWRSAIDFGGYQSSCPKHHPAWIDSATKYTRKELLEPSTSVDLERDIMRDKLLPSVTLIQRYQDSLSNEWLRKGMPSCDTFDGFKKYILPRSTTSLHIVVLQPTQIPHRDGDGHTTVSHETMRRMTRASRSRLTYISIVASQGAYDSFLLFSGFDSLAYYDLNPARAYRVNNATVCLEQLSGSGFTSLGRLHPAPRGSGGPEKVVILLTAQDGSETFKYSESDLRNPLKSFCDNLWVLSHWFPREPYTSFVLAGYEKLDPGYFGLPADQDGIKVALSSCMSGYYNDDRQNNNFVRPYTFLTTDEAHQAKLTPSSQGRLPHVEQELRENRSSG